MKFRVSNFLIAIFLGHTAIAAPTIHLKVSVDWEGESLSDANIGAMREFRRKFPNLKLIHFLNPANFTKPKVNLKKARAKVKSVIKPGDTIGLHLHGWKSVIEGAGVTYRYDQTVSGMPAKMNCILDCGEDVPISAYTEAEVRRILKYSVKVLSDQGFAKVTIFRAGAWMGAPHVLSALAAEGIFIDSSAVPLELVRDGLSGMPGLLELEKFWPNITPLSQDYVIYTSNGPILETPNNGAMIDYMTEPKMVELFEKMAEVDGESTLHLGFHQETSKYYLKKFAAGLKRIFKSAKEKKIKIIF